MTLSAADLGLVTQVAQKMVRESLRQAARGGLSVPVNRPGTLISWSTDHVTAQVTVDGDAFPIQVTNALSDTVPVGSRVLVHFEPPQGAFLWRILGTPPTMPQTFIPHLYGTGAGLGDSSYTARYTKRGRDVRGFVNMTLGAAVGWASDHVRVALPTRIYLPSTESNTLIGHATYYDTSTGGLHAGPVLYYHGDTAQDRMGLWAHFVFGATVLTQVVNGTQPFTWVPGDQMWLTFAYEAAES